VPHIDFDTSISVGGSAGDEKPSAVVQGFVEAWLLVGFRK
jgi:hypothetical protein